MTINDMIFNIDKKMNKNLQKKDRISIEKDKFLDSY